MNAVVRVTEEDFSVKSVVVTFAEEYRMIVVVVVVVEVKVVLLAMLDELELLLCGWDVDENENDVCDIVEVIEVV